MVTVEAVHANGAEFRKRSPGPVCSLTATVGPASVISAACSERDFRYSRLIAGLKAANIQLNRKMLSELAIHDPAAFDAVLEKAQAALAEAKSAA